MLRAEKRKYRSGLVQGSSGAEKLGWDAVLAFDFDTSVELSFENLSRYILHGFGGAAPVSHGFQCYTLPLDDHTCCFLLAAALGVLI